MKTSKNNDSSYLDWTDPEANVALTKVLLKKDFNLDWDMPISNLCPPVPNRANYIHWIEDLLKMPYSWENNRPNPSAICGIDV